MKILHVADTHLGFSAYRKMTEEGINQREMDVYDAFKQFVDYAIRTHPDLIIHAGDLFDAVRPNNRAIRCAIQQINRLSKERIPFLVIAGNHEHPKLKETGHIFSIFDHMDHVYPIYHAIYEQVSFTIENKKITIHALPQCELKEHFSQELQKLKPDSTSDYNIFVAHGAVTGIKIFSMNEFNELVIPTGALSKQFDYIALGHFHTFTKLAVNAFYAGSTERFTFTDAPDRKGFIELDLSKGTVKPKFIELQNRPMTDIQPIKCSNLKLDEVMKKIKETVNEINPTEKTFRITLEGIPAHIYRGLDFNEIRQLSKDAIHYEIKANVAKEGDATQETASRIDALAREFKHFLDNQQLQEKEILLDLGVGYIEKIEAKTEGK